MSGLILPSGELSLPRRRGRPTNASRLNAVRNPDGLFINSGVFSEAAKHFMKHGYYCGARTGTPDWREYWTQELDRCKNGITIGGVRITGPHYGYLNYAPIQKLDKQSVILGGGQGATKITGFPDFWDGDYNYFHAIDIARNGSTPEEVASLQLSVSINPEHLTGNKHMLVGKARRKGYSFKNAWLCTNNYNTVRNSLSLIGAFDKAYLYGKGKGTMVMAASYLNFLNEHTGWRKQRLVDRQEAVKAGYVTEVDGTKIEAGYLSEIIAITFKDNPDAARGKDPLLALLEEIGAWPDFKKAWAAIAPGLTAGKYVTGQMIGFGTGGDMESGTMDFAEMFYNPQDYNLMPFINIWDEDSEHTECAFFHPMQWNRDGYYDEQGNSDTARALADEEIEREKLRNNSNSGSAVIESRVQELPTCPAEAFLTVSTNGFPVTQLRKRQNLVKRDNLDKLLGQPVTLFRDETGKVRAKPDMNGLLKPIYKRKPETEDLKGAVIIYEYPIENCPRGLYKLGYDPVGQDEGSSLNAIYVMKSTQKLSATSNTIVARYIGRGETADDTNELFAMLCELYNNAGMHENMVLHVKTYFRRRNKMHLLAAQPDNVISKNVKESRVDRIVGCHMSEELKAAGAQYIKRWLLTPRGMREDGTVITNIDTITDEGLLEELIMFGKGNFDRVMALMMALFQIEEELLETEYDNEEQGKSELLEFMEELYVRGR